MIILCKCSHLAVFHHYGEDGEGCKPSCGCTEWRLDARSKLRDEPVQDVKSAATGDEAA